MTETEKNQALWDMLYLAVCGVNGYQVNKELFSKMDLELVYRISRFHTLTAITYMAIAAMKGKEAVFSEEQRQILRKWQEAKNKACRKNALFDIARGQLENYLTENKIWYLPLKGVLLQSLYPAQGMRQMADNDILFDAKYQKEVHDYFISQGFEAKVYAKGNHDVYQKTPVLNFEMHTSLYSESHREGWSEYYSNVYDRLLPEDGNPYHMHFTNEDFYVYFISHAYKHHNGSGTGLRTLMDAYVYLCKYEAGLDFAYVKEQLTILGIAEYEKVLRGTALKVFGEVYASMSEGMGRCMEKLLEDTLNSEEWKLLTEMLGAGTYGTMSNRIQKKLKEIAPEEKEISLRTKLCYYWSRFCPADKFFKAHYPFIYRHKWLKPFFLVWRAVKGLLWHPKKLFGEIKMVWMKK